MAKPIKLSDGLGDPDDDTSEENPTGAATTATATKKPAKKSSAKKAASGRKRGSGAKKAASKRSSDAASVDSDTGERTPRSQIRVKGASTKEAEKFLLYVHPDYWRALEFAKVEDRVDRQARIRAMIALWNEDPIFKAAVDRIARTAPRGQH